LQISDDNEGLLTNEFLEIISKFDSHKEKDFEKNNKDLITQDSESKRRADYGNNLKLGALRLGDSVLFISKNKIKNILNVCYFSVNNLNNPDVNQNLIIFAFSYDKKNKCYLTEKG
jgi:hypothetical protein